MHGALPTPLLPARALLSAGEALGSSMSTGPEAGTPSELAALLIRSRSRLTFQPLSRGRAKLPFAA
jgi:hypothetical protein